MISKIISVITALPQIIKAIKELMAWWDRLNRERAAERAKEVVNETTRTGDQRAEEEILNPGGGGRPSVPESGLIIRDRRDRTND